MDSNRGSDYCCQREVDTESLTCVAHEDSRIALRTAWEKGVEFGEAGGTTSKSIEWDFIHARSFWECAQCHISVPSDKRRIPSNHREGCSYAAGWLAELKERSAGRVCAHSKNLRDFCRVCKRKAEPGWGFYLKARNADDAEWLKQVAKPKDYTDEFRVCLIKNFPHYTGGTLDEMALALAKVVATPPPTDS